MVLSTPNEVQNTGVLACRVSASEAEPATPIVGGAAQPTRQRAIPTRTNRRRTQQKPIRLMSALRSLAASRMALAVHLVSLAFASHSRRSCGRSIRRSRASPWGSSGSDVRGKRSGFSIATDLENALIPPSDEATSRTTWWWSWPIRRGDILALARVTFLTATSLSDAVQAFLKS